MCGFYRPAPALSLPLSSLQYFCTGNWTLNVQTEISVLGSWYLVIWINCLLSVVRCRVWLILYNSLCFPSILTNLLYTQILFHEIWNNGLDQGNLRGDMREQRRGPTFNIFNYGPLLFLVSSAATNQDKLGQNLEQIISSEFYSGRLDWSYYDRGVTRGLSSDICIDDQQMCHQMLRMGLTCSSTQSLPITPVERGEVCVILSL